MNATRSVLAIGLIALAGIAVLLFVRSFRAEPVPRTASPPRVERRAPDSPPTAMTHRAADPVAPRTAPRAPAPSVTTDTPDPSDLRHRVRVLSAHGAPVADARVEVAAWSDRDARAITTTDDEGLAILSFGDEGLAYWIRVDHVDYPAHDAFLERSDAETTITLEEGRPVPVEVIHESSGEPIEGLAFSIRARAESARPLRRVTDADGVFVVTLPLDHRIARSGGLATSRVDYSETEGTLELPFACEPELADWQARVVRAYDPESARAALLECFASTGFDVTVLQADGGPAVGAMVRAVPSLTTEQIEALFGAEGGSLSQSSLAGLRLPLDAVGPFEARALIYTDAQGRARVRRIQPGLDYVISATNDSHHFGSSGPHPAPLGRVGDVVVQLDGEATGLRVHVMENDESVEGYHVVLETPDGRPALASRAGHGPPAPSIRTVAGEGALFPILQAGRYRVEVSRQAMRRTEAVDVVAGTVTEKTIRFDGGLAIEGRVVDGEGRPVDGVSVAFEAYDGSLSQPGAGTAHDGRFEIHGLTSTPGALTFDNSTLSLTMTPHGERIVRPSRATRVFERLVVNDVTPGGAPLEIRLRDSARLRGRLHLPDDVDSPESQWMWVRVAEVGQPDSEVWRDQVRLEADRPAPLSLAIPILDRPVDVTFYTNSIRWTVPDTLVFRSGETADVGDLRPD